MHYHWLGSATLTDIGLAVLVILAVAAGVVYLARREPVERRREMELRVALRGVVNAWDGNEEPSTRLYIAITHARRVLDEHQG